MISAQEGEGLLPRTELEGIVSTLPDSREVVSFGWRNPSRSYSGDSGGVLRGSKEFLPASVLLGSLLLESAGFPLLCPDFFLVSLPFDLLFCLLFASFLT